MSTYLSQVWKLLINYVRGTRLQQMSKTASLETEAVLPLRKNIKEPDESLKFVQDYLPEYLLCEKLQKSIQKWTLTGKTENSNIDEKILSRQPAGLCFAVSDRQLHEEIYNLLGEAALKPEIVNQLMELVVTDRKINPELLFWRLEDFYRRWCQGEFIDATPEDNLPQKKMLQLAAKNVAIGLRQVDVYTGLNVLILLLELHRYAQEQDRLKQKIIFYPSAQPDTDNFFTSELLRIVNYSDALAIGNFSTIIGQFLKSGNFIGAYLGDANLTGVDFSNANLSRAYLGDANLTGVNFCGANLTAANLGDANLSAANLSGANLSGADLSSANLSGANLSGANLSGANLSRADLSSANLTRANLKSADLNRADLSSTNLNCTDFSNAILFGANLSDANLSSANLSHADLCRGDLSGADLSHAILNGTNLSDTILFSTNLKGAILVAADLSYAKLNGAKLNNARLDGAMFLGADLSSTDLSRVTLNEADLSGVILNDADLSGADLTDAILFGTDLSYANLNNANLSGSNLSGAMLNGANLSHSNLSSAILGGADLSDANMEQMTWGQKQQWESVRGLDTAVNVPEALKEELGLK
ncbi:pentapeptide repeat-containing protein [Nostoc linckia z18]|uniref:Pentapeptide repeat-containing protein n=2 Tax=Nostoc linckia TaxID=92942 RepID=A0A9Q5Z6L6_NOSLI|nr:pentapeptide repeat-containing protein [Nostoc linckia]PHK32330.1 pentapeptide repeat-containing protein [Nostoc linckia z15]PHK43731.1 pentapeptide repeat-containing protein [Nostoc linckia z16]PHJ62159.1 pentapeptide repeat-containing protein [Nostoc linckia z1]PHJ71990.1 pentapeptide repeat-containing protein [Nostoc linckia z3]PHJ77958.1 pentapeptide repeat-containing protein [Nostoc linckia z2]